MIKILDNGSYPAEYYMALNLWIISAFISTCYTFSWDIKMDWGLFSGKYFLREQTIYSRKVRMLNNLVFNMLLILCVYIYIHYHSKNFGVGKIGENKKPFVNL